MNKKLLICMMMWAIGALMPAVADELTVYEGTETSTTVPAYMSYWDDFTKSQVVIPATELADMAGGTITFLKFYTTNTSAYTSASEADVFLKEVDYTTIDAFEPKTSGTIVYHGKFVVTANGEITIELTTPYTYGGGNLLIGTENTDDTNYKFIYFKGQSVTGAAVYGYNANSTNDVTPTQGNFIPKTTFTYVPAGGVICYKPTNLKVENIGTDEATVSWTAGGTETAWNLEYKKAADTEWTTIAATTTTVALTDLTNGTNYDVRVQGDYGNDNLSDWVSTSFRTKKCDDEGYIQYVLADSYGDGWNGNAINVYNATTNELIDSLTIVSGDTVKGSLPICLGETYRFEWVKGSYSGETSFSIIDPFGEEIFVNPYGSGNSLAAGVFATYKYQIITAPVPKNFAVNEITAKTATATWDGIEEAKSYTLRYRTKGSFEKLFEESFENNSFGNMTAVDADSDGNNWTVALASSWTFENVPMQAKEGDYMLYSMSTDLTSSGYPALDPDNWLISPKVDLKGTLKFWMIDDGENLNTIGIYVSTTDTEIASFQPIAENLQSPGSATWTEYQQALSAYEGQQGYIAIRHYNSENKTIIFLDAISINGAEIPEGEWVVKENATSPYKMEELTPETTYEAQVQAVYETENSDWTDMVEFTTLTMNIVPTDLEVTDVTATTATVEWEGVQDSYNVRYRTPFILGSINEGFEQDTNGNTNISLPEGWTSIDADGDGNDWYHLTGENFKNHDGIGHVTSASYNGSVLTPDNWLVTPLVALGGTLSFWACGQDASDNAEVFQVYVKVGDGEFTALADEDFVTTGEMAKFEFDLSAYAGKVGKVAIRHYNCTDQFRLNIDDFVLENDAEDIPAGEWITLESKTSPCTIEGLTPETTYEVQVQGVYEGGSSDWTASELFTTLAKEDFAPLYIIGEVNGNDWAPNVGVEMETNDGQIYTASITIDKSSNGIRPMTDEVDGINYGFFSFTTELAENNDEGGWAYIAPYRIGAVSNGDFRVYKSQFGQELSLTRDNGQAFQLEEGTYELEVDLENMKLVIDGQTKTGIENLNMENVKSIRFYNLQGIESATPFDGVNIVVREMKDGSKVVNKVIK